MEHPQLTWYPGSGRQEPGYEVNLQRKPGALDLISNDLQLFRFRSL